MIKHFAEYWTQAAKDCYETGCICKGCYYSRILESPCEMKQTVLELVRKFGRPPEEIKEKKPYLERKLK